MIIVHAFLVTQMSIRWITRLNIQVNFVRLRRLRVHSHCAKANAVAKAKGLSWVFCVWWNVDTFNPFNQDWFRFLMWIGLWIEEIPISVSNFSHSLSILINFSGNKPLEPIPTEQRQSPTRKRRLFYVWHRLVNGTHLSTTSLSRSFSLSGN